MTKMMSQYNF